MSDLRFYRAVIRVGLGLAMSLGASCSDSTGPSTGAVRVSITTTGVELGTHGYTVAIDGGAAQAVPVNGTMTLSGLSPGSHTLLLAGLAPNCAPTGAANPRSLVVVAGDTAHVAFTVNCVATAGRILFVSERSGTPQIYVMNPDGSGQIQLTSDSLGALDPNWSPDGTMLVYSSIHGISDPFLLRGYYAIVVKKADGSGGRTLVNLDDTFEPAPAWSPGGSTIAYFDDVAGSGGQIFLVNADGTGLRQFTSAGNIGVAWSPDGSKIAFSTYGGSGYDLFVKDVNGSSLAQLTTTAGATDRYPSWSPDGTRIAFVSNRDGNEEIYVMNADGSRQTRLTTNPGVDFAPTWAPDGSRIAFHSDRDGSLQIYVMNADGSGLTRLTTDPAGAAYPSWGR
jgi:Tol biopolymer transport system component